MTGRLYVRITYPSYNSIIFLGTKDLVEGVLGKLARVYCMKLENGKIVLTPAPDQENPRRNKCFRAIVYKNKDRYLFMRLSKIFMTRIGSPRKAKISRQGDNLILEIMQEP